MLQVATTHPRRAALEQFGYTLADSILPILPLDRGRVSMSPLSSAMVPR